MKTQAAIAHSSNANFTIEEIDLADPGVGEVRVKVHACGICRSDLSALEGKETLLCSAAEALDLLPFRALVLPAQREYSQLIRLQHGGKWRLRWVRPRHSSQLVQ